VVGAPAVTCRGVAVHSVVQAPTGLGIFFPRPKDTTYDLIAGVFSGVPKATDRYCAVYFEGSFSPRRWTSDFVGLEGAFSAAVLGKSSRAAG